jgi:hypothetical protein
MQQRYKRHNISPLSAKCKVTKHGRTEDLRKALHIDIKETLLIIIDGDFNDSNTSRGLHYMLSIKFGLQDSWGSQTAPRTYV